MTCLSKNLYWSCTFDYFSAANQIFYKRMVATCSSHHCGPKMPLKCLRNIFWKYIFEKSILRSAVTMVCVGREHSKPTKTNEWESGDNRRMSGNPKRIIGDELTKLQPLKVGYFSENHEKSWKITKCLRSSLKNVCALATRGRGGPAKEKPASVEDFPPVFLCHFEVSDLRAYLDLALHTFRIFTLG